MTDPSTKGVDNEIKVTKITENHSKKKKNKGKTKKGKSLTKHINPLELVVVNGVVSKISSQQKARNAVKEKLFKKKNNNQDADQPKATKSDDKPTDIPIHKNPIAFDEVIEKLSETHVSQKNYVDVLHSYSHEVLVNVSEILPLKIQFELTDHPLLDIADQSMKKENIKVDVIKVRHWLKQFWLKNGTFSGNPDVISSLIKAGSLGVLIVVIEDSAKKWIKAKNFEFNLITKASKISNREIAILKEGGVVKLILPTAESLSINLWEGYPAIVFSSDPTFSYKSPLNINNLSLIAGKVSIAHFKWIFPSIPLLTPTSIMTLFKGLKTLILAQHMKVKGFTTPKVYSVKVRRCRDGVHLLLGQAHTFLLSEKDFMSADWQRVSFDLSLNLSKSLIQETDRYFFTNYVEVDYDYSYQSVIVDIQSIMNSDGFIGIVAPHGIGKSTLEDQLNGIGLNTLDVDEYYKEYFGDHSLGFFTYCIESDFWPTEFKTECQEMSNTIVQGYLRQMQVCVSTGVLPHLEELRQSCYVLKIGSPPPDLLSLSSWVKQSSLPIHVLFANAVYEAAAVSGVKILNVRSEYYLSCAFHLTKEENQKEPCRLLNACYPNLVGHIVSYHWMILTTAMRAYFKLPMVKYEGALAIHECAITQ